jgi:hypothetical protein
MLLLGTLPGLVYAVCIELRVDGQNVNWTKCQRSKCQLDNMSTVQNGNVGRDKMSTVHFVNDTKCQRRVHIH